MSTDQPLAGMTALVTGGSGGIGSASARHLLRDGAAVVLMARKKDLLEETRAALLAEVPGGRVELHAGDGCVGADVKAALQRAHGLAGRLDIIVATVGLATFRPLLLEDETSFRDCLERNVMSAFLAVRHGAPLMGRGGSIVCISSTAATMPFNALPAYNTAKAALEMFVRAAAEELGQAGIRVNAVRPGLTRKNMPHRMFTDASILQRFVAEMPLGRAGEPDDIAAAVRYLAGPESAWVTGQSFAVDGGQEARKNPDLSDMVDEIYGAERMAAVRAGRVPD
jgi:NAD(P)-dependent dehydrogenase (short-subunit alcohol dehydrogenase family)